MSTILKAKTNAVLEKTENTSETLDYSYEKLNEMLRQVQKGIVDEVTAKRQLMQQSQTLHGQADLVQRLRQQGVQNPQQAQYSLAAAGGPQGEPGEAERAGELAPPPKAACAEQWQGNQQRLEQGDHDQPDHQTDAHDENGVDEHGSIPVCGRPLRVSAVFDAHDRGDKIGPRHLGRVQVHELHSAVPSRG